MAPKVQYGKKPPMKGHEPSKPLIGSYNRGVNYGDYVPLDLKLVDFGKITKWYDINRRHTLIAICKERKLPHTGIPQVLIERLADYDLQAVLQQHAKLLADIETEDTSTWYMKLLAADEELVKLKLAFVDVMVAARWVTLVHSPFADLAKGDVQEYENKEKGKVMAESEKVLADLQKKWLVRHKEDVELFRVKKAEGLSSEETAKFVATSRAAPKTPSSDGLKEVIDLTDDGLTSVSVPEKKKMGVSICETREIEEQGDEVSTDAEQTNLAMAKTETEKDVDGEQPTRKQAAELQKKDSVQEQDQDQVSDSSNLYEASPKSSLKRRANNETANPPRPEEGDSTFEILQIPKKQCIEHPVSPEDIENTPAIAVQKEEQGIEDVPVTSSKISAKQEPQTVQDPTYPTKKMLKQIRKDFPYLSKVKSQEVLLVRASVLPVAGNNAWQLLNLQSKYGYKVHSVKDFGHFLEFEGSRKGRESAWRYRAKYEGALIGSTAAVLSFQWIPSTESYRARRAEEMKIQEEKTREKREVEATVGL